MKIALGGTFNHFHRGHEALLERAASFRCEIAIGLMTDAYCAENKMICVPFERRESAIKEFMSELSEDFQIIPISVRIGSAADDPDISHLVVSEETAGMGERINSIRKERGLTPVEIVIVPYVLAEDYRPISSTRVVEGEIDRDGRLLRPLKVGVGSANPIKLSAVRNIMQRIHRDIEIISRTDHGPIPKQPKEGDVLKGATARAREALGDSDLGVGIEAGVFQQEDGLYDVQYCVIVDGMGRMTVGHGMGFRYPPSIADLVGKGRSVGEACAELFEEGDQGRGKGAIGILTDGIIDRTALTEQCVLAAMVPRIRKDLYW